MPARTPTMVSSSPASPTTVHGAALAPVDVAVEALGVVNRWADMAAAARAKSFTFAQYQTQTLVRGSQKVLQLMNRTISDGTPTHVFALATGQGSDDIVAIATVTTQVMVSTATDMGGRKEVVEIRELVVKPHVDGQHRYISELIRMIHSWAGGRFVTMSLVQELEDYYRGMQLNPTDMVLPALADTGPGGAPPNRESLRLLALRFDSGSAPVHVPLRANAVVSEWANYMASARTASSTYTEYERQKLWSGTRNALSQMNRTIADGSAKFVFALSTGDGVGDVQALATVTTQTSMERGGQQEVVAVRELVASPTAEMYKGIAELIRRIYHWAGGRHVTVSLSSELEDYYRSLGYEPKTMFWPGANELEEGGSKPYRMMALDFDAAAPGSGLGVGGQQAREVPSPAAPQVEAAPVPQDAPMFVPWKASVVVSEWAKEVSTSSEKATSYPEYRTQRVVKAAHNVLGMVNRTIADGIPEHVFALAAGEGVASVKAIATVTTQVDMASEAGGVNEVVYIRELVARPSAEGHRYVVELRRRIQDWAGGRFVVISQVKETEDYYASIGFVPMAGGKAGLEEPSGGEQLRMLELDPAPEAGSEPPQMGLQASAVVDEWSEDAKKKTLQALPGLALGLMNRTIAEGLPNRVFALTTGDGLEDVQALATITTRRGFRDRLRGKEVVEIRELIAKPSSDAQGQLARLISEVHKWAAGRVVTVSKIKELEDYYKTLGFEVPVTAPSGSGSELSSSGTKFRMIELGLDAKKDFKKDAADRGAREGGAQAKLRPVPLESYDIITRWAEDAAAHKRTYSTNSDYRTNTLVRSSLDVLHRMQRTIIEGTVQHVFALSSAEGGEGAGDIQAIATVWQRRRGFLWLSKVVEITEITVNPAAAGKPEILELIHRIQIWAAPRQSVTLALNPKFAAYYKGLGFDFPIRVSKSPLPPSDWERGSLVALRRAGE